MHPDSTSGIFRYSEPGFTPDPREHRMALTTTPDGVGAIVASPATQKVHYGVWVPQAKQTNDPLQTLNLLFSTLAADQLLTIPATAVLTGHKIILVPGIGFSADEIRRFYAMAFTADRNAEILTQEIFTLNATAIFAEQKDVVDLTKKHLPEVQFYHGAIEMMLKDQRSEADYNHVACTMFLTGNTIFIHVHRKGETLFFNSFTYQTDEELLYYMAAIARNLELDPQTLAAKMTGMAKNLHQYSSLLAPFFPLAEIASTHPSLHPILSEQGHHLHLLAIHLL